MSWARASLVAAAGIDPWALGEQVAAGDPDTIEQLASRFFRAAGHLREARAAAARAGALTRAGFRSDRWPVTASEGYTEVVAVADPDQLPAIARSLSAVGDDLAAAQRACAADLATLRAELTELEATEQAFVVGHRLTPQDRADSDSAQFRAAVERVALRGSHVAGRIDSYEATLTAATRSLAALGYTAAGDLDPGTPPSPPRVGSDPTSVAEWWAGLTTHERRRVLAADYTVLGQLQGLPAPVLDRANRARLTDYETALHHDLLAGTLGVFAFLALLHRCAALRGGLGRPDDPVAPPRYLLRFDPDAPQGTTGAEVALGDPDVAEHTLVFVPGSTHSVADIDFTEAKAQSIYDTMHSPSKSVVLWLDGPLPPASRVALDSAADASAPRVVDDLHGLAAAHQAAAGGRGHVTALGHSYGTYVLGKALARGGHRYVDDAIFTGSPGVGVDHATDLGMDPRHVWSGQAGDDWILTVRNRFTPGVDGTNPEEGAFGARHFDVTGSHGHSEYLDDGSRSLTNIGHIADGDYARVHTVGAPDYRGPRELFTDSLDGVWLDPANTDAGTAHDLLAGRFGRAGDDLVDGLGRQGRHLLDTGSDLVTTGDEVVDALSGVIP